MFFLSAFISLPFTFSIGINSALFEALFMPIFIYTQTILPFPTKEINMQDELYMARAIALAQKARNYNKPNPEVGALIVYENRIIGEGYHALYGQAHAEVNAVNSVKEADKHLLDKSTIYVTLEPCFHFGKTPPCVELILKHKIPRVVIGALDTFSLVAGQSIEKLKANGVEVKVGVLEKEVLHLTRRFFTNIEKQRPYIVLKFAQSADGFIGKKDQEIPITDAYTKKLVHKWRGEEQAILVATNTAITDNPQLTNRFTKAKQPLRLVIDKKLQIQPTAHLLDNTQMTWVFTTPQYFDATLNKHNLKYIPIQAQDNALYLQEILAYLHQAKIQSILVEGGAKLLQTFIDLQLFDEIRQLIAPQVYLQDGIPAPIIKGAQQISVQPLLSDYCVHWLPTIKPL